MKATFPLVHVVGDVGKKVGRRSITLDHDAILLVSVIGRAKPDRTVQIEDLAGPSQGLDSGNHTTVIV